MPKLVAKTESKIQSFEPLIGFLAILVHYIPSVSSVSWKSSGCNKLITTQMPCMALKVS